MRSREDWRGACGAAGPGRSGTAPRNRVAAGATRRWLFGAACRADRRRILGTRPSRAYLWYSPRALPDRRQTRRRRHGRSLSRGGHALGRAVAVKVSHERFSDRFEREARAIAAFNHPHICTLHDVGPELPGDGVRRGRDAGEAAGARQAFDGRNAAIWRADRGRAGGGARQGHHPSRSEARQHHAERSRA